MITANLLKTNYKLFPLIYKYNESLFESELGLAEGLRKFGLTEREVREDIAHERAHFETAERFWANPIYGIASYFLIKPENDICYSPVVVGEREGWVTPFVRVRENRGVEEMVKIISAPENLSTGDKDALILLEKEKVKRRKIRDIMIQDEKHQKP
ncbi:hypothetical protein J4474_04325 [Candidatus Pacearchaeota archaeon]|nr:hypothetical protein [Candidatus Pacearchaeota archaeon]